MGLQQNSTNSTVTNTASQVISPNANRNKIVIQNMSASAVYYAHEQRDVVAGIYTILGGYETIELTYAEDGDIALQSVWARVRSGLANLALIEFTPDSD